MTNPDDPAFGTQGYPGKKDSYGNWEVEPGYGKPGLTKREYFASKAMQGILAGEPGGDVEMLSTVSIAGWSIRLADALIAELNKEKP